MILIICLCVLIKLSTRANNIYVTHHSHTHIVRCKKALHGNVKYCRVWVRRRRRRRAESRSKTCASRVFSRFNIYHIRYNVRTHNTNTNTHTQIYWRNRNAAAWCARGSNDTPVKMCVWHNISIYAAASFIYRTHCYVIWWKYCDIHIRASELLLIIKCGLMVCHQINN